MTNRGSMSAVAPENTAVRRVPEPGYIVAITAVYHTVLQPGRVDSGCAPCNCLQGSICESYSISRCALLNGPAGSFSKDIDELNLDRVMVTRNACARFGEENDYRNS